MIMCISKLENMIAEWGFIDSGLETEEMLKARGREILVRKITLRGR